METGLMVTAGGLTQVAVKPREVLRDPLAAILAGQLSEHTRRASRHDVGHLLLFLRDGAPTAWGELTREAKHAMLGDAVADPAALRLLLTVSRADLIAFRTRLREVGLLTLAINRRLTGVRSLLRELHRQGHRPDNPAERIRMLRVDNDYSPTRGLTAEQA